MFLFAGFTQSLLGGSDEKSKTALLSPPLTPHRRPAKSQEEEEPLLCDYSAERAS